MTPCQTNIVKIIILVFDSFLCMRWKVWIWEVHLVSPPCTIGSYAQRIWATYFPTFIYGLLQFGCGRVLLYLLSMPVCHYRALVTKFWGSFKQITCNVPSYFVLPSLLQIMVYLECFLRNFRTQSCEETTTKKHRIFAFRHRIFAPMPSYLRNFSFSRSNRRSDNAYVSLTEHHPNTCLCYVTSIYVHV